MNNGMNLNPYGINKNGQATNQNGQATFRNSYSDRKAPTSASLNKSNERVNYYNKAYSIGTTNPNDMDLNKPVEKQKSNIKDFIPLILVLASIITIGIVIAIL